MPHPRNLTPQTRIPASDRRQRTRKLSNPKKRLSHKLQEVQDARFAGPGCEAGSEISDHADPGCGSEREDKSDGIKKETVHDFIIDQWLDLGSSADNQAYSPWSPQDTSREKLEVKESTADSCCVSSSHNDLRGACQVKRESTVVSSEAGHSGIGASVSSTGGTDAGTTLHGSTDMASGEGSNTATDALNPCPAVSLPWLQPFLACPLPGTGSSFLCPTNHLPISVHAAAPYFHLASPDSSRGLAARPDIVYSQTPADTHAATVGHSLPNYSTCTQVDPQLTPTLVGSLPQAPRHSLSFHGPGVAGPLLADKCARYGEDVKYRELLYPTGFYHSSSSFQPRGLMLLPSPPYYLQQMSFLPLLPAVSCKPVRVNVPRSSACLGAGVQAAGNNVPTLSGVSAPSSLTPPSHTGTSTTCDEREKARPTEKHPGHTNGSSTQQHPIRIKMKPKSTCSTDFLDPTRLKFGLDDIETDDDGAQMGDCSDSSDMEWRPSSRDVRSCSKRGCESGDGCAPRDSELVESDSSTPKTFFRRRKRQSVELAECDVCGKVFKGRYYLRRHQMSHNNIRPFQCQTCHKCFKQKAHLIGHQSVHQRATKLLVVEGQVSSPKPKPYSLGSKCPGRPKKSYTDKDLACKECGKTFKTVYRLKRHELSHTDLRPFSCRICGKGFKQTGHRNEHEANHEKTKKRFLCSMCGVVFRNRSSFGNHLRSHGTEKLRLQASRNSLDGAGVDSRGENSEVGHTGYDCPYCTEKFATAQALNSHLETHVEVQQRRHVQPYSCDICRRAFTYRHNLIKHKLIHKAPDKFAQFYKDKFEAHVASGKPSFKCAKCAKVFLRKETLSKHCKIHTGSKPFKCAICCHEFTQNVHLKVHMRKHTGSRPFQCKECNRSFIDSTALAKHVEYEACQVDNCLYHCRLCDKLHYYLGSLKQHIRKKHDIREEDVEAYVVKLKRAERRRGAPDRHPCKLCSSSFSEKCNLVRHIRRKHARLVQLLQQELAGQHSTNHVDASIQGQHSTNHVDASVQGQHSTNHVDEPVQGQHSMDHVDEPVQGQHSMDHVDEPVQGQHSMDHVDEPVQGQHSMDHVDEPVQGQHFMDHVDAPVQGQCSSDTVDVSVQGQDSNDVVAAVNQSQHSSDVGDTVCRNHHSTGVVDDFSEGDTMDTMKAVNSERKSRQSYALYRFLSTKTEPGLLVTCTASATNRDVVKAGNDPCGTIVAASSPMATGRRHHATAMLAAAMKLEANVTSDSHDRVVTQNCVSVGLQAAIRDVCPQTAAADDDSKSGEFLGEYRDSHFKSSPTQRDHTCLRDRHFKSSPTQRDQTCLRDHHFKSSQAQPDQTCLGDSYFKSSQAQPDQTCLEDRHFKSNQAQRDQTCPRDPSWSQTLTDSCRPVCGAKAQYESQPLASAATATNAAEEASPLPGDINFLYNIGLIVSSEGRAPRDSVITSNRDPSKPVTTVCETLTNVASPILSYEDLKSCRQLSKTEYQHQTPNPRCYNSASLHLLHIHSLRGGPEEITMDDVSSLMPSDQSGQQDSNPGSSGNHTASLRDRCDTKDHVNVAENRPLHADNHQHGADNHQHGADTPEHGADTPEHGADTPGHGADTPDHGAESSLVHDHGNCLSTFNTYLLNKINSCKQRLRQADDPGTQDLNRNDGGSNSSTERPGLHASDSTCGVDTNMERSGLHASDFTCGVDTNMERSGLHVSDSTCGVDTNMERPGLHDSDSTCGVDTNMERPGLHASDSTCGVDTNMERPGLHASDSTCGVDTNMQRPGLHASDSTCGVGTRIVFGTLENQTSGGAVQTAQGNKETVTRTEQLLLTDELTEHPQQTRQPCRQSAANTSQKVKCIQVDDSCSVTHDLHLRQSVSRRTCTTWGLGLNIRSPGLGRSVCPGEVAGKVSLDPSRRLKSSFCLSGVDGKPSLEVTKQEPYSGASLAQHGRCAEVWTPTNHTPGDQTLCSVEGHDLPVDGVLDLTTRHVHLAGSPRNIGSQLSAVDGPRNEFEAYPTESHLKYLGLVACKDARDIKNKITPIEDLYKTYKPWLEDLVNRTRPRRRRFCHNSSNSARDITVAAVEGQGQQTRVTSPDLESYDCKPPVASMETVKSESILHQTDMSTPSQTQVSQHVSTLPGKNSLDGTCQTQSVQTWIESEPDDEACECPRGNLVPSGAQLVSSPTSGVANSHQEATRQPPPPTTTTTTVCVEASESLSGSAESSSPPPTPDSTAGGKHLFTCLVCHKYFTARHQLRRHEVTHTDHRPYSCDRCGRAFRQKVHLSDHTKRHQGQRPFVCARCGKRFVLKNEMNQHIKNHCRGSMDVLKNMTVVSDKRIFPVAARDPDQSPGIGEAAATLPHVKAQEHMMVVGQWYKAGDVISNGEITLRVIESVESQGRDRRTGCRESVTTTLPLEVAAATTATSPTLEVATTAATSTTLEVATTAATSPTLEVATTAATSCTLEAAATAATSWLLEVATDAITSQTKADTR